MHSKVKTEHNEGAEQDEDSSIEVNSFAYSLRSLGTPVPLKLKTMFLNRFRTCLHFKTKRTIPRIIGTARQAVMAMKGLVFDHSRNPKPSESDWEAKDGADGAKFICCGIDLIFFPQTSTFWGTTFSEGRLRQEQPTRSHIPGMTSMVLTARSSHAEMICAVVQTVAQGCKMLRDLNICEPWYESIKSPVWFWNSGTRTQYLTQTTQNILQSRPSRTQDPVNSIFAGRRIKQTSCKGTGEELSHSEVPSMPCWEAKIINVGCP